MKTSYEKAKEVFDGLNKTPKIWKKGKGERLKMEKEKSELEILEDERKGKKWRKFGKVGKREGFLVKKEIQTKLRNMQGMLRKFKIVGKKQDGKPPVAATS